MFACLHAPGIFEVEALAGIGRQFSPSIEICGIDTVVFSMEGLERLIGSEHRIASEIARLGAQRGIQANLAIASNPDAALHAARHFAGVTLIPNGQEAAMLGVIPVAALSLPDDMRETLLGWGIRTFAEFAALPPLGIVERFGAEGLRLQDKARGAVRRPLVLRRESALFEREAEFDHPLDNSQSLLFVINGMLAELCAEMRLHGVAASGLRVSLRLDGLRVSERTLSFAIPMREPNAILKLLQLHLDSNPPGAAVMGLSAALIAVDPRVSQNGLFTPAVPEPARLQILLARIGGIVGNENVGSAELLDTHRPDAFVMKPFQGLERSTSRIDRGTSLVMRLYRPPLGARVIVERGYPRRVAAAGISGNVTSCGGPWRGSGDWWAETEWARDEWDVALSDGGLYRIFYRRKEWFVAGVYD